MKPRLARVGLPVDRFGLTAMMLPVGVLAVWEQVKWMTPTGRLARAAELPDLHDGALFSEALVTATKPGRAGPAFALLCEAVALAAYQPGGITIFGQHWNATDGPIPRAAPW